MAEIMSWSGGRHPWTRLVASGPSVGRTGMAGFPGSPRLNDVGLEVAAPKRARVTGNNAAALSEDGRVKTKCRGPPCSWSVLYKTEREDLPGQFHGLPGDDKLVRELWMMLAVCQQLLLKCKVKSRNGANLIASVSQQFGRELKVSSD